jgi:hypothetical protein
MTNNTYYHKECGFLVRAVKSKDGKVYHTNSRQGSINVKTSLFNQDFQKITINNDSNNLSDEVNND